MPKRSNGEDSDEYIRRKIRKIEKKLRKRKKRSRRMSSSSSDSRLECASPVLSIIEDGQEPQLTESVVLTEQLGPTTLDVEVEPGPAPSPPTQAAPEDCTLDSDILELLGASPSESKRTGDNIQKDIALRWEHIATSGLSKDARKDLLDKHLVPGNCPKLASPLLNPEIKAALSDTMIGKDKASQSKQSQITSVIACIGEALTKIFQSDNKDPSVIKPLLDGAQLLCDLQHYESMKRRSLICASIKKDIKSQIYDTRIDEYLFGENLADTLKAAKAINKSGSEIKATKPKVGPSRAQPRTLNLRPQLASGRQPPEQNLNRVKRRQQPASNAHAPTALPPPAPPQWRQYPAQPLLPPLPPPPPPPPPQQQQQYKKRPYQRR